MAETGIDKLREHVRASDPDTSHAAAASIDAPHWTVVQERVLDCHLAAGQQGLTDEELLVSYVQHYGVTAESSPRKRRHDLTRAGTILDSAERRMLKSGRLGIVWKLKARMPPAAA